MVGGGSIPHGGARQIVINNAVGRRANSIQHVYRTWEIASGTYV